MHFPPAWELSTMPSVARTGERTLARVMPNSVVTDGDRPKHFRLSGIVRERRGRVSLGPTSYL